ncbi:hypothetical protein K0B96_02215 [Horticoccus luteus]|uniref:Uncharacterized protein n=1 Tax=Horticoccus luteus TaxID=2862869 RepID=A0A8F9XLQ2_9BACT|nr:hypothetical protein [Horticoccus luteus]QYM79451.1 hypothetical protein K0B96_02215 [Horticoccus luteus]
MLAAAFLAGNTVVALAAEAPAEGVLRRILSPAEFSAAGLDKLSPEELSRLETALIQHHQLPAASKEPVPTSENTPAAAAADFGREQVERERPTTPTGNEIRGRIDGSVQDIGGRSLFLLDNGQIWQQRIPDQFHLPKKLVNPEVVISRGLVGYKMVIVGADIVVFVKRIR